jgi:hypothetical protein
MNVNVNIDGADADADAGADDVVPAPEQLQPAEQDNAEQEHDNNNDEHDNNNDEHEEQEEQEEHEEEEEEENEHNDNDDDAGEEEEEEDMDEEDEVDEEDDEDEDDGEAPDDDVLDGGVAEPHEEGTAARGASQADIVSTCTVPYRYGCNVLYCIVLYCTGSSLLVLHASHTRCLLPILHIPYHSIHIYHTLRQTLFLTCDDKMNVALNHPVLRPGTTVQIGLDKNTKLSAVFERYVFFCNQHAAGLSLSHDTDTDSYPAKDRKKISTDDLEFVHCQLLKGNDTTEAAALMKNDRITVRKEQSSDRDLDQEHQRQQREADKEYFQQLRQLVPGAGGGGGGGTLPHKWCDVVLDCRGSSVGAAAAADDVGRMVQQVLSTTVRCHSVVLRKRCPWLGRMIDAASREQARRSIVSLPDVVEHGNVNATANTTANTTATLEQVQHHEDEEEEEEQKQQKQSAVPDRNLPAAESKDSEDDDIEVLNYNARVGNRESRNNRLVAQIETDEDEPKPPSSVDAAAVPMDDDDGDDNGDDRDGESSFSNVRSDALWVTLANHSPDAAKLLLEFCYTNRVIPLGCIAFLQSCKSKPDRKHHGPVPPFSIGSSGSRHWPNRGEPTASFPVVVATLGLAEEASLPRLSLMCEIAAAQLVSSTNVVDALAMCQTQKELTGNSLPRLRKAAMDIVLRSGPRGVFVLPTFRRALEERGKNLIPTLLAGTMEAVDNAEIKTKKGSGGGDKRDWQEIALEYFEFVDREDANKRERERRKRRMERWESDPSRVDEHGFLKDLRLIDNPTAWATAAQRRSLKRMSHQMDQMAPPQQSRRSSKSHRSGMTLSRRKNP